MDINEKESFIKEITIRGITTQRAGKPERNKNICPLCGGKLREGLATLPFIIDSIVAVVKNVPVEICEECDEPYMKGDAVDRIEELLQSLRNMAVEVSVIHYKAA